MTDEQTTGEAWREVGRQFQALGESLATAFRTAWESEENREHVQDMKTGHPVFPMKGECGCDE